MRLTPDTAARILACQGVYTLRDTARHFGVSPRTVHEAWHGRTHRGVVAAPEPPNVKASRVPAEVVAEDGKTLLERGMSVPEAAAEVGVCPKTLRRHVREAAPGLFLI